MFTVKEIFTTVQGEGSKAGKPAIFVRFAGCNLWSGLEKLRHKGKGDCALWCDTDFVKGDKFSIDELFNTLCNLTKNWAQPFVVFTGGEPMLQLKKEDGFNLIKKLLNHNFWVAVETNGTIFCEAINILHQHPKGHITVSPKPLMGKLKTFNHIKCKIGTDLKVVLPTPFDLNKLNNWDFENYFVQPVDTGDIGFDSLDLIIDTAKKYGWQISMQLHKLIGLP